MGDGEGILGNVYISWMCSGFVGQPHILAWSTCTKLLGGLFQTFAEQTGHTSPDIQI